jgi:NADH-quinone oxidoreductase subunit K
VFVLFIVAVAACEAGIAMALFVTLYRRGRSLDASDWQSLRELGVPPTVDTEPLPAAPQIPDPVLTPAGRRPASTEEEPVRV